MCVYMLYVCYTYPVSRMTYTDEYRACIPVYNTCTLL